MQFLRKIIIIWRMMFSMMRQKSLGIFYIVLTFRMTNKPFLLFTLLFSWKTILSIWKSTKKESIHSGYLFPEAKILFGILCTNWVTLSKSIRITMVITSLMWLLGIWAEPILTQELQLPSLRVRERMFGCRARREFANALWTQRKYSGREST